MSERKFYNLDGNNGQEIYNDHIDSCACCGGRTEEMSAELGPEYSEVYRCELCGTRVARVEHMVEVLAEPERAENVLEKEYPQYEWPRY